MRSLKAYLWLLAALALSGLLLMFLYVPSAVLPSSSAPRAGVSAGYILRGVHFWAGNLAVLTVSAHLIRTIFVKTNRRRVGWAMTLVFLTLVSCFTGYLLPWDQLAFWMQRLWLPNIGAQDAVWPVYWMHTLGLSLLTLPFSLAYVRRTHRDLAASVSP